jgi:hypothetical protein
VTKPNFTWTLWLLLFFIVPIRLSSQVSVTTWHNDNWRTGQNTDETILTATNVSEDTFGLLCKISFSTSPQQEQAYAQPLVVGYSNGSMTVYVATMQDYVYAFNVPKASSWTSSSCGTIQNNFIKSAQLVGSGEYPADACLVGNGTTDPTCVDRLICPSVGVLSLQISHRC